MLSLALFFLISSLCKDLLEMSNLIDLERKMALYRCMFACNVAPDGDPNYIKQEALKIELMAGGLTWEQQGFVLNRIPTNDYLEVSTCRDALHEVPCRRDRQGSAGASS
ncbi:unnamed protein product [Protopolystoma xenopodis]|uniref:Uncharacterized protein n=1 Tax=Protopolystoma xenopodis TaxID=117903 RepID=A0A448WHQ7_9PLAT|nr:unnamed protein product [Protopolystoma xenopodis]